MSSGSFVDRTAFVTGGASGIGRATALLFARSGASVFAVDVDEAGLGETAASIRAAGGLVATARCDVTAMASVKDAVGACVEAFGGLGILCNVAGVGGFYRFEEITEREWARVIGVNLTGAFHTIQAAMSHLLQAPGRCIVNVASAAALRGTAYAAPYAASKAGLLNLSRSLALEFATRDLRVNCVCPGGVRTPLLVHSFLPREDFEMHLLNYNGPPKPGTFSEPDDVAGIIAFLASDAARTINGAWITCDGGALA